VLLYVGIVRSCSFTYSVFVEFSIYVLNRTTESDLQPDTDKLLQMEAVLGTTNDGQQTAVVMNSEETTRITFEHTNVIPNKGTTTCLMHHQLQPVGHYSFIRYMAILQAMTYCPTQSSNLKQTRLLQEEVTTSNADNNADNTLHPCSSEEYEEAAKEKWNRRTPIWKLRKIQIM
jgi:hypothetical protein